MNGIRRRFILAIVVSIAALGAAVAVHAASQNSSQGPGRLFAQAAQGGGPGPGRFGGPGQRGGPGRMGPGGPIDLPLGRLNLTDAQKDQVKAIMEARQEEMRTLGDRARAAREALRQSITAEPIDEATIRARSSEVAAVDADLAVAQARIRAEVFQILTPEQQALTRSGGTGGAGRSGRPR